MNNRASLDAAFWAYCKATGINPDSHPTMEEAIRQAIEAYEAAKESEQPVDCRSAFEEWALPVAGWRAGFDLQKCVGVEKYASLTTEYAWMAWQAAWNSRTPKREVVGHPVEPDKYLFQEAIEMIEKKQLAEANFHIRYSVKTTALFSYLAEPIQHAVDNETLKTFCGRDASEYWKLDADLNEKDVNCASCRKALERRMTTQIEDGEG